MDTSSLMEHPYFDKQINEYFWFKKDDVRCNLYFNEDVTDDYPIIWHSPDMSYSIWKAPSWFKHIYLDAHHLYFKKDRIRYLSGQLQKPFRTLLFMSTFFEENGQQLYEDLIHLEETGFTCFKQDRLPFFENLAKNLKKEHYKLTIRKVESGDYMISR